MSLSACRYFHGRGTDDDKGGIVPAIQVDSTDDRCENLSKVIQYCDTEKGLLV